MTEQAPKSSTASLVIEHSKRIEDISAKLDQLSTDFIESHDTLQEDILRIGGKLEDMRMIDSMIEPESTGLDKLFSALAKAQTEIENAEQDAENKHFQNKYASLASVMSAIRPALSKNGLCILQMPGRKVEDSGVELLTLTTVLGHSSGQSVENYFEMYPPKKDPQGIGSAMTYMRRYAAMAICGIAGAVDDDAETALAAPETISAEEADMILAKADELFGSDADALLARMCDKIFAVESVPKIPKGQANIALKRIENTHKRKLKEKEQPKPAKDDVDDGGA